MFRRIRIAILLLILVFVALGTWLERARSTDWDRTLWVGVYPLAQDDSAAVEAYLGRLSSDHFAAIAAFIEREAQRYGVRLDEPVRVRLYGRVSQPPPPLDPTAGALGRALWSLQLRYWAWRAAGRQPGLAPDVRLFVLFHDPARTTTVPHSLGLQKGLLGVVHAFADPDMEGSNNIVIAHELLHTLGATDKYGPDNLALYPQGFAKPDQRPLYPQHQAEIMAGRTMLDEGRAEMPTSLARVVVGAYTASEIGWVR